MITIHEILESQDVNYGAFLVWSEVIEGARRPLVFLETVKEDFSLIGAMGTQIYVPTASQLTATKVSSTIETTLASGMTSADKTISKVTISVTNFYYSAVTLSDILVEDYPNIDWVRLNLRNMGAAVMEAIDNDIYGAFAAGFGVLRTESATLDYGKVIDAIAAMENNSWIVEENNPPFLIVSPDVCANMMQDTAFVETTRYYAGNTPTALMGEAGMYAGCRLLKTPLLNDTGRAFIVFPSNGKYGTVSVLAWKRRLRVKSERYETKEHTYYTTTARCIPAVVQAYGICRINMTNTP
jgi:N4-gp56 family major capsid protein